jgi:hypothetical protein
MRVRTHRLLLCAAALALAAGAATAGHRHRNVSIDHDEPRSCADIRVEFDDQPAFRAEERATIAAGGTLRIEAAENSGIFVREADRSDFEIVLCKAAPAEAELAAIALSRSGGKVSVTGPPDGDWAGHLLVAAPRGASLELSASNGPIGLDGISGQVVARTENGPISAKGSTGDLDLEADNGPIEFAGDSGHSKLRTQNGPIGVRLEGRAWQGQGLDARAVNGPVSVSIPPGYGSAAVVESAGRSPFTCRGEACGSARKTWDDDGRRIEVGEGPVLVRVATVNGPVSVRTGKGDDADED